MRTRLSRVTSGSPRTQSGMAELVAIQEEVASRPGFYSEVIISTLPVDFSKWLEMDLPEKVKATFGLPVTHVYGGVTTPE